MPGRIGKTILRRRHTSILNQRPPWHLFIFLSGPRISPSRIQFHLESNPNRDSINLSFPSLRLPSLPRPASSSSPSYLLLPPSILPSYPPIASPTNSVPPSLPVASVPLFSGRWEFSTPFFAVVHPCRRPHPQPLRKLPKAQLPQLSHSNLSQAGHPKIENP